MTAIESLPATDRDPTASAFDDIATDYDRRFTHSTLGRWQRETVWREMEAAFEPCHSILDLGCGTGEDAVWLAQRGIRVDAVDSSSAMLEQARRKSEAAGVTPLVRLHHLDLEDADRLPKVRGGYDGILSNFGVLNCVERRTDLAIRLADRTRPQGTVILVLMGRLCAWEILWHLACGEPRRAFRRFDSPGWAQVGEASERAVRVWYPSPRQLTSELEPFFERRALVGIGFLLPPPYLGPLAERWPRLVGALAAGDRRFGGGFFGRRINDHYLLRLVRR